MATGVLQGLVILVVAQFLRHPPRAEAASAKPAAGDGRGSSGSGSSRRSKMLRTPQFYVMYIAFVLMATGGLLVTANAGPMARSWGFSPPR